MPVSLSLVVSSLPPSNILRIFSAISPFGPRPIYYGPSPCHGPKEPYEACEPQTKNNMQYLSVFIDMYMCMLYTHAAYMIYEYIHIHICIHIFVHFKDTYIYIYIYTHTVGILYRLLGYPGHRSPQRNETPLFQRPVRQNSGPRRQQMYPSRKCESLLARVLLPLFRALPLRGNVAK